MSEGAAKKEERRKFQAIKGTRDLLPPETALWNRVEQTAREVFSTFGYGEIRPPVFERTELFARSIGAATDVVSKEMYSFEDRAFPEFDWLKHSLWELGPAVEPKKAIELAKKLAGLPASLRRAHQTSEFPSTDFAKGVVKRVEEFFEKWGPELSQDPPGLPVLEAIAYLLGYLTATVFSGSFGESVSLRPEATASACRAYIEHNMNQLPQPVKLYYVGPMFRRERPQKGRYRQFYQIGAEVLEAVRPDAAKDNGKELAKDAAIDAEVIEMLMTFFDRIGLQGIELSINSIGHAADNCRRGYVAKLREELMKVKDQLGVDSQRRIETNPLRVLDSKLESEQGIIATLPRIADHLCDDCRAHYAELKRQLDLRGFKGKYKENWRLVRGLDYYMRTTFEITARGLGSQDAVCGGGRYDGLVELLGGPPTKGIGFAIGEDRVVLSLVHDEPLAQRRDIDLVLAWLSPETYTKAVELARNLRTEGVKVDLPTKLMRAGDAVRYADRIGAYFTLLLGEDELKSGQLTLKHMLRQEQMKITEEDLLSHLKHQSEMRGERTK